MSCPFKQFADIFGKPNEGVHSYRIFNIAIVDVIATLLGALLISYLFKVNFFLVAVLLFLLGIVLHRLFCVNTTINKFLFGSF
jgi:uncharacterized membrane protein YcaP (DUF421 family)